MNLPQEPRYGLQLAQDIANEIIQSLHPECVQIEVAGSIRRLKPDVKDIEIVYISNTTTLYTDLFNIIPKTYFHVDQILLALITRGILAKDTTVKRWGAKYKRVVHRASGIVIELFRAEPDNWGYILALRTGPANFNHLLVTKRSQGGALPPHITLREGCVWRNGEKVPTPTEESFFTLLNLPLLLPQERTAQRLRHCIEERQ